jgi:hypothetical protein
LAKALEEIGKQIRVWLRPLINLIDDVVNRLFRMRYISGLVRLGLVVGFGVLGWLLLAVNIHPYASWRHQLPVLEPGMNPYFFVLGFFWTILRNTFLAWDVLTYVILGLLPFFAAIEFAAIYLDDIYELNDIHMARRFIWQTAFSVPDYDILHVENGEVRPEDRRLPVFRIGGPGYVQVGMENACVFERMDGEARVIGPTNQGVLRAERLDGFERLRGAIDLRDQTANPDVVARTRDGIQLTVRNIRVIYSVIRPTKPSHARPYPYQDQDILNLVYNQNRDTITGAMNSLITVSLRTFLGTRLLGEIMAAITANDIDRLRGLTTGDGALGAAIWAPERMPRADVTDRNFYNPSQGATNLLAPFIERATRDGVQLHWIDVGTWHIPTSILSEQYLEALQLTIQNQGRNNLFALRDTTFGAWADQTQLMLRQLPLDLVQLQQVRRQRAELSDDDLVYQMVKQLQKQLRNGRDQFREIGRSEPNEIRDALRYLQQYDVDYARARGGRTIAS